MEDDLLNLIQPVGAFRPITREIRAAKRIGLQFLVELALRRPGLFSRVDPGLWELVYHNP